MRARGDRDLVLAGQVRVVGIAVEELRHLGMKCRDVEELVVGEARDRAAREVAHGVAARADGRQAGVAQPVEDGRQRAELEVVQLDRLAGRQLTRSAAVLVRELADRAQLLGRDPARRQLDPEHERPDLRLVVVGAPPLEPDEILLLDVGVPGRDQRGELVEHRERALLALQSLDRIPLEHELECGRFLQCARALRHAVPSDSPGNDRGPRSRSPGRCRRHLRFAIFPVAAPGGRRAAGVRT